MDSAVYRQIAAIHQTSCSCVLALTGGGATAASQLLAVPGASRTILEVQIPYSEEAFCQFLAKRPDGFCSASTSVDMAEAAWSRAMLLRVSSRCVGLGCTASLATDRPKRGDHRFFAAVTIEETVKIHTATFEKGARTRAEEEDLVSRATLNLLAEAAGVNERLEIPLRPGEVLKEETGDRGSFLTRFVRRDLNCLYMEPDGRFRNDAPPPAILLPGSFNPLHDAHGKLAGLAAERLHLSAAFELSISNVDKPALRLAEIRSRLAQFHGRSAIWLTHAPTFVEKARVFPGCAFVVGVDTAERIMSPRYYPGGEAGMASAADELRTSGCRFLVAARVNREGRLLGLEDIAKPSYFDGLFEAIPKDAFNVPISSSELRKRANDGIIAVAD